LLARAISRQREIATRLALGSSRARIVRQSLIEALMLSFIGGVLGLAVAFAATRALIAFVAEGATNIPLDPRPDAIVLLFTFSISLFAGLLFGLAPALHAARSSAGLTLTASTRTAAGSAGRGGRVWPKVLVTAQIMLSLLLLVGAGLFLRTLRNLADQDFGFESTHLLIAQFDAHLAGYKPEQAPGLNQRLLERLSSIPGVRSAALAGSPPVSSSTWRSFITIPGYTPAPKEDMSSVLNRVTGNYFETAGISMLAGRAIGSADNATSLKVAVINQVMASKFFPKGDAVGRTLKVDVDSISGPWHIVGVARDTKSSGPREETDRMIYFPLAQVVGKNGEGIQDSFVNTILLRTTGDPATAIHDLRSAVATVDPNLPILQVHTIQEQLESFMSHEVLISRLTAIFAALALLLACIGLYGVLNYNVQRRTNEIGLRIALGATGSGVRWMVMRESLLLLVAGLVLGLPIALTSAHLLRSQLYEMSPFDPGILALAVGVIAVVTVLAAWLPARSAAAIDPTIALRCD
jgi:predicted permease